MEQINLKKYILLTGCFLRKQITKFCFYKNNVKHFSYKKNNVISIDHKQSLFIYYTKYYH